MIKLKKLLKESKYAWDRKFGDPLPTFKDVAETHQKEKPTTEDLDPYKDFEQIILGKKSMTLILVPL